MDIDFYKKETEETFKRIKFDTLMDSCGYDEENANAILEILYYAVADEYGC